MLIEEVMSHPVRTISPGTTLSEAYGIMQEDELRHLPVVDDDAVVGVVTDRDLRLLTSSLHPNPFDPEDSVHEVMSRDLVTASPRDPVEEAARLMRRRKIGCLPVLGQGRLVGIVTGTDLLDALTRLTGLDQASSRVEVLLTDEPGRLLELATLVADLGLNIHSLLTHPSSTNRVQVILRLNTMNPAPLLDALRDRDVEILWPRPKTWSR